MDEDRPPGHPRRPWPAGMGCPERTRRSHLRGGDRRGRARGCGGPCRAEALGRELPNASIVTLAGAGRHGLIEAPTALAAIISTAAASSEVNA